MRDGRRYPTVVKSSYGVMQLLLTAFRHVGVEVFGAAVARADDGELCCVAELAGIAFVGWYLSH